MFAVEKPGLSVGNEVTAYLIGVGWGGGSSRACVNRWIVPGQAEVNPSQLFHVYEDLTVPLR